jgi:hypothetical protein|tara:strand:- start:5157 stop:5672 length:516 start_codon:yes stop_codon:yes gene_type:complete
MKTHKAPQISSDRCAELSRELGLTISNRAFRGVKYPVVKKSTANIDTSLSYLCPYYTEIIDKLKGDVLVLGLGFGRSIIECCDKESVREVVVVEHDINIIKLFWALYGQEFSGVDKLSIIEGDAREYKNTDYDHVFIDIFHTPINMEIYKKEMGEMRERFKETEIHFIDLY